MPEAALQSHGAYIDALFNRGEESCRALYDRISGQPSRTAKGSRTGKAAAKRVRFVILKLS